MPESNAIECKERHNLATYVRGRRLLCQILINPVSLTLMGFI